MNASDLIGLGVIVVVIAGALVLLNHITKPYAVKNEEEFQKKRKEGVGLQNLAVMGLQQFLDPASKKALEVQEDLRRGIYDDKEEPDDPPEAGADARENLRSR